MLIGIYTCEMYFISKGCNFGKWSAGGLHPRQCSWAALFGMAY